MSPLSIQGVRASLRRPTTQDWLASIKAYLAVALALAVGFSQNLDNPYWSALTIYVLVAQPQSGAVRSKALFRLGGTVFGGCMAIALAGVFGDHVGALLSVLTLFLLGALYLQQLDRTPTAYLWFATGLTAAVIGLVHVQTPDVFFAFATARMAEITVGIVAIAVVDAVAWPASMTPGFLKTMEGWREKAQAWMAGALARPDHVLDDDERWERRKALRALTAQLAPIDAAMVQLPYDIVPAPARRRDLRLVRNTVVALIAEFAAAGLWRRAVARLDPPDPLTVETVERVKDWFTQAQGGSAADVADRGRRADALLEALTARRRAILESPGPAVIVQAATVSRLIELVRQWSDLDAALHAVETRDLPPPRVAKAGARAHTVRSVDYLVPVLDLAPMALAMGLTTTIWYLTAWSSGLNALLFAFLGCFFVIGQPASLRSLVGLLLWTSLAFVFTFTYLFVVLPRVTAYPVLIGVLGVALVPLGLLAEMSLAGLLIVANGFAFLGLQNAYQADFNQSLLSLGGSLAGLLISGASRYLCSYDRPRFIARRLVKAVRLDVMDAAGARRAPHRDRFLQLSVDRLVLFFTITQDFERDDPLNRVDMISDFRIGANLLALREDERHLSGPSGAAILALRRKVAATFRDYARGRRDLGGLLEDVDRSFSAVQADQGEPQLERLLMALTGLRLALLPGASLAGLIPGQTDVNPGGSAS